MQRLVTIPVMVVASPPLAGTRRNLPGLRVPDPGLSRLAMMNRVLGKCLRSTFTKGTALFLFTRVDPGLKQAPEVALIELLS